MTDRMYSTEELINKGRIPEEFSSHILSKCPKCRVPIYRNWALTRAKCINPSCPIHGGERLNYVAKKLGLTGVGPKTGENIMWDRRLDNHMEVLPYILGDYKPYVHLWEIADMCCIEGMSKTLEEVFTGFTDFESYFLVRRNLDGMMRYKNILCQSEKCFTIKEPLSKVVVNVMLHGSIPGYRNRDMFIQKCNDVAGKYVRVKNVGKRVSDVTCLITESKHDTNDKVVLAKENGIPIYNKMEFLNLYNSIIKKYLGNDKDNE